MLAVIIPYLKKTTSNVALSGTSVYSWMKNNGYPIKTFKSDLCLQNVNLYSELGFPANRICSQAARNGDLNLLKWARQSDNRWYLRYLQKDWDETVCEYAAANGHLEVLKWARGNGCPWDEWTCVFAAGKGHLECLKWARENGCPWDLDSCKFFAAECRRWEVLKWLSE